MYRIKLAISNTYGIVKASLYVPSAQVFGCFSSFTAPARGTATIMPTRGRIPSPATSGDRGSAPPITGSARGGDGKIAAQKVNNFIVESHFAIFLRI
mmetsp:Transcript_26181/g.75600  ORF Transcript_26181/g.75600 Transcript_26181/m.75600 type:complete len:97 (-) Transcript_26181:1322-1612(-)